MKNVAHSVAQRLLDAAKKSGDDNTLVCMRFATERLLYRIGQSKYFEKFILKGATLFLAWHGHGYRTTKDVDLLGFGKPDPERLIGIFRELCTPDTSAVDGLVFLAWVGSCNDHSGQTRISRYPYKPSCNVGKSTYRFAG